MMRSSIPLVTSWATRARIFSLDPHFSRTVYSVSSTEVNKFGAMRSDWWDPQKNPLIGMNPIRVEYIKTMVGEHLVKEARSRSATNRLPLEGLKALDIGCGGGLLSESLARLGANVTAVDPAVHLVEVAQQRAGLSSRTRSIDYRAGQSAEDLLEEHRYEAFFDVICLLEVLEHVSDVPALLETAQQLLAPGGLLFVSTMSQTTKSYLLTIVGAEYLAGYLPIGTHTWSSYLSPEAIQAAGGGSLEQLDVQGMIPTSVPLLGIGKWEWKLDPTDLDVNWIGTYKHATDEESA